MSLKRLGNFPNFFDEREVAKYLDDKEKCVGMYCGRIDYGNGFIASCGTCPPGTRVNSLKFCELCMDSPSPYDWMYLIFMFMMFVLAQNLYISYLVPDLVSLTIRFTTRSRIVLVLATFIDAIIAAVVAISIFEPVGELSIHSCRPRDFFDWYSILHYTSTFTGENVRCPQETVYPLYSIPFYFYGISLILILSVRIALCALFGCEREAYIKCIKNILYIIPMVTIVHTTLAGVLYETFPYISIILSIMLNLNHFSVKIDQPLKNLILDTICVPKNLMMVFIHWFIQGFGIVAIIQIFDSPHNYYTLLFIIPLPTVLYIGITRFNNPFATRQPTSNN